MAKNNFSRKSLRTRFYFVYLLKVVALDRINSLADCQYSFLGWQGHLRGRVDFEWGRGEDFFQYSLLGMSMGRRHRNL